MMFTLRKEFRFEASHRLPHHDGKCARQHGHSWRFEVVLKGSELQHRGAMRGMLFDYGRISEIVKPLIEEHLDHYDLNLIMENPTSEQLAVWLFDHVRQRMKAGDRDVLHSIVVHETCTSACEYHP